LVVFSPAFAFWGGALFKDGLIFLVLNLLVYNILRLQTGMRWKSLLIALFCLGSLKNLTQRLRTF
jgi:hypothetical protein